MSHFIETGYPPADECFKCGRKAEQGKSQIVATLARRALFTNEDVRGMFDENGSGDIENEHLISIDSDVADYLYLSTKVTEEQIAKAKAQAEKGTHPFFCYKCAYRSCRDCGGELNIPTAVELVHTNGKRGYRAIMPINAGCKNTECQNYKEIKRSMF